MSSNKETTNRESSEPWAVAQPAMKQALGEASHLYNSKIGAQGYKGSTAIPFDQRTIKGFNQMEQGANTALPAFQQQFGQVANNAAQGGLNALQRGAVAQLQPMASGGLLNGNPWIDQVIGNTSRDIAGADKLMASAAGRYGSGGHQNVTEKNIGDMSSQMRMQDYGTERGYMQDAIGSLFSAGQQQQNNVNANTGAMQDAYGGLLQPGQTMADIGGNYEDYATRLKNDELRKFNDTQNLPWENLARYQGIASGMGQLGGTGTTTAQGPSRLAGAAGGALGGYGLLGPAGAVGGGLLGLLG